MTASASPTAFPSSPAAVSGAPALFHRPFSVVAYRGGGGERPENTLLALRHCRDLDVIPELDLALTADRRIIALHDDTLDRTTNGSGRARLTPYATIASLDAGCRFTDAQGEHPYREAGVAVPLLEEVLAFDGGSLVLDVHFHDLAAASELVRLLEAARALERVCVACVHQEVCDHLARVSPRLLVAASPRSIRLRVYAERVRLDRHAPGERVFFVPESYRGTRIVTPRFVETCRQRAERVLVLEVETPEAAARARSLGVHGLFTSRPAALGLAPPRAEPPGAGTRANGKGPGEP